MTCIVTLSVLLLYIINLTYQNKDLDNAKEAYLVYLDSKKIGIIEDDQALYNLINEEQKAIKSQYDVSVVYPPTSFEILKTNTYDNNYSTVDDIYNKIAELDSFTIKGYIVTIKFPEEEQKEPLKINVLDKDVFEQAIRNFVLSFITEEELESYVDGEDRTLTEIGSIIKTMYFNETITIKEGYISVNEKIFTDVESLSQYLLFGPDAQMSSYTVEYGDSIDSISENNKLNPQEFIVANPKLRGTDTVLAVGSTVNITLLNPIISLVCEMYRIEESTVPYAKKTVVDSSKPYGYSEVTQSGVTGINLNYEYYQVKNGEQSSEIIIDHSEEIRKVVDQITTVGKSYQPVTYGTYVDNGTDWGWPTNQPSIITSKYGWRWGKVHQGIDISGTGYGSPIYAIANGVVVSATHACSGCAQWANGNYVVIRHAGNYYSAYLHLAGINVSVGQTVTKGQRIASMGASGYATGTHLHLGFFQGEPYAGVDAQSLDPLRTIYNQ